ncbi:unnamed protein product [Closterium sp. Naga37s-1]|nr:unnamed protein product [Closterium sp. Naga37s-1]
MHRTHHPHCHTRTKADSTPWCFHTYALRLPPLSSCPPYPRVHINSSSCPAVSSHAIAPTAGSSYALTVRVSRDMLRGGTGCTAWPASLFLAEALLSHPSLLLPSPHRPSTHSPFTPTPAPADSTQGAPAAPVDGAAVGASKGPGSTPVAGEPRPVNAPVCLELGATFESTQMSPRPVNAPVCLELGATFESTQMSPRPVNAPVCLELGATFESTQMSPRPVNAPVCLELGATFESTQMSPRPVNAPVCLELGAGCGLLGLCLAPLPLAKMPAPPLSPASASLTPPFFCRFLMPFSRPPPTSHLPQLILTDASTASLTNLCTNLATNALPFSSSPEIPLVHPLRPHGSKRTAVPSQGAQHRAHEEEQSAEREEVCKGNRSEGAAEMQGWEGVGGEGCAGGEGGARVHVQQLCWEEVTPALASSLSADVIIGADIVYDPSVVPALADALAAFLSTSAHSACTERATWQDQHPADMARAAPTQHAGIPEHVASSPLPISLPPPPYALIASTHRNPLTMACFLQALHDRGLQVTDVAVELLPHCQSRPLSRWFHYLELPEADRMMLHLIHM